MEKHVPNLFAALWGLCFFAILVLLSKLVRPDRFKVKSQDGAASQQANVAVELNDPNDPNVDSPTKPAIRLPAAYQVLLAAASVLFFGLLILFPAAATFRQGLDEGRGFEILLLIGLFVGTLAVALTYAWMKGDLTLMKDPQALRAGNKDDHGNSGKRAP